MLQTIPNAREIIKELRKRSKISRKELADMVGVSVRTVESWEQGARIPSKPAQKLIMQLAIMEKMKSQI
jgi:DNA-binding transcriptional regulator YiaG